MGSPRYVYLDPLGSSDERWLYVLVAARTGVVYQQQYGGFACLHGQLEGFLVPLFAADALDALREMFERYFRGAGTLRHVWSEDELARLREIVATIRYWACDGENEEPHDLRLDDSRIGEADEAWVPVITPDGPGVLVWCNSD